MILLLIYLLSFRSTPSAPNDLFLERALSDTNYQSFFIALNIKSRKYEGKAIVENGDLYSYLRRTKKMDKEKYKQVMKELLSTKAALTIKGKINLRKHGFIIVPENKSVEAVALKGREEFLRYYFEKNNIKSNISILDRNAIIYQLFEWKVLAKIDDISGYIIIIK